MFEGTLTLHGQEGTITWGYRTAAVISSWTVYRGEAKTGAVWTLRAVLKRADPYALRQPQLKFTAPRIGGFFCWPIRGVNVEAQSLAATLGPPES